MVPGPLIVVSGPSGSGKSTVVARVVKESPKPIRLAVTATTREPREGEENGVSYHFWTTERFLNEIAASSLIEHAFVHGQNYYGTPRFEVEPYRERGTGVILVIDVQGAEAVRKIYPEVFSIFLDAPNLRQRLEARGETPENIEKRMASAQKEASRKNEYNEVLLNDDLETAVREMSQLIRRQFDC